MDKLEPVNSPQTVLEVKEYSSPKSSNSTFRNDRRLSSSGPFCRICHEGESASNDGSRQRASTASMGESLISPCDCIGSLGLVHRSCLEHWLSASGLDHCEICKYKFNTQRKSKPFCEWVRNGGGNGGPGSGGLLGDMMCLTLLTPLCLVSVYLCAMAAAVYLRHGVWEGAGLAVLCCFLLIGFLGWCSITFRYHWTMFKKWRTVNQVVHLLLDDRPPRNSVSYVTIREQPAIFLHPADTNNNDGAVTERTTELFSPERGQENCEMNVFI